MKRRLTVTLLGVVAAVLACMTLAYAQNDESAELSYSDDSFVDIGDLFLDIEFTLDENKVSFPEGIYRKCILFAASYADGKLIDVKHSDMKASSGRIEVLFEDMGLDITGADMIKAMLLSDTQKLTPCSYCRTVNLVGTDVHEAYMFVYSDGTMDNGLTGDNRSVRENIPSGWVLDNRGGAARVNIEHSISGVTDISTTQGSALIREFNKINEGRITAEFSADFSGNGICMEFRDESDFPAYRIRFDEGSWYILGSDGEYTHLADNDNTDSQKFRIYLDFVSGKSETYIDDVYCGEHALLSDNTVNFRFAIDREGIGTINPGKITMTANYGVFENFDTFGIEEAYGWETQGDASVSDGEIVLPGESRVTKSFSEIGTKYAVDMLAIFPENENVSIRIKNGNAVAVELKNDGGVLCANGIPVYEKLTANMWYRLRIEADPTMGQAEILVNARTPKIVPLRNSGAVDTLDISSESGNARIDEIEIKPIIDYEDYVPEPSAKADLDDYIVVTNVCSLWKDDSTHFGWAVITPYDENKPVLGYYDEGSPESADWEIKFMVEHGIDAQAFCWYAGGVQEGPIKTPRLSSQLHDGYQLSRYEDYMKYCIIWEASGTKFKPEQFRNYVIPYWFENYFLDENYLVIDNRLVLYVYSINTIVSDKMFGTEQQTKIELEYLEEVAREHGFDGMLYVSNGDIVTLANVGIDASAAYHWGATGYTYETNVSKNLEGAEKAVETGTVYQIPTISVGYSDFAWRNMKMPLMSLSDYDKCHDWVKNTYIPEYAKASTWQEKLVWLSTWNEYGEGTYIMPAEALHGFGYLDVLRDNYTSLKSSHTDVVPTQAQGKRIQYLYPQYARLLRYQGDHTPFLEETVTIDGCEYVSVKKLSLTSENVKKSGVENLTVTDGVVSGTSSSADFQVYFEDAMGTDISNVDTIRVRMKVPKNCEMQIFYSTEEDKVLNEVKSIRTKADTSEIRDYMFNLNGKQGWSGKLGQLRIDPATGVGIDFEIYEVELLDARQGLIINNQRIKSVIQPELMGDEYLFPYDPETAVNYIMHSLINWNHEQKILTIEANNHKVVYTVGKNTYTVDGEEKALGYTLYQTDGLPMLSYKTLAEALGFTFRKASHNYIVETPEIELYSDETLGKTNIWEFNYYTTGGWSGNNAKLLTNDGYITLDNTRTNNKDPNITKHFDESLVPAAKYSAVEVRMKYECNSYPGDLSVYFTTGFDTVWNEKKRVSCSLPGRNTGGEYQTFTIDVSSNESWYGYIKSIRVDPFNAIGYAEIDYIKLIENPDYDEETAEDFSGIINGDAEREGVKTFYSNNATVTIEEDSANPDNHVYRFIGAQKKSWTYAIHVYPFKSGKTYKISFDARAISDSNGDPTDLRLSVNIQYAGADGNTNHVIGGITLPADGEWRHYEKEYTVKDMKSTAESKFSCYIEPPSETTSGSFELDNVVINLLS